jgi:hypothetical protein
MKTKFIRMFFVLGLILSWTVNVFPSGFHTFHTSLTRIDYNSKEKNIEISIQLFNHDLQPMLERRLKKRVDLEKTAEVESEIFLYLQENFIFQNKKGEVQKLKWVGKEFDNDVMLVYIEIPFDEDLDGARLQNSIFFESFPEQTNIVVAQVGEKKIDLLYKSGDKFKSI